MFCVCCCASHPDKRAIKVEFFSSLWCFYHEQEFGGRKMLSARGTNFLSFNNNFTIKTPFQGE